VSHNAPYMHFSNKEELLATIAKEGFAELKEQLIDAIKHAGSDQKAQLEEAGVCYVEFAVNHPRQIQIMFQHYSYELNPELEQVCIRLSAGID
jgi:AcrR family transcriptional regulator